MITNNTTTQQAYEFLSNFWYKHSIDAKSIVDHREVGRSYGWLESIQGAMEAHHAIDDSENEIRRCLGGCVCGQLLIYLAIYLRDSGYVILLNPYNMDDWLKEEVNEMSNNIDLTDSQRAQLLLLYKSKLQSLGDEAFFDDFDNIRRRCYDEIGIDIEEMEAAERSKAASKLGKHGGESTSEAKSQAARENGKRGGRRKSVANVQLGLNLHDI